MAKYKVGDELVIINDPTEEERKLKDLTTLVVKDDYVQYDKPNVTLTYRNVAGQENKVFAVCKDVENFDQQKVLEKALLKAFQSEIIQISVNKNK